MNALTQYAVLHGLTLGALGLVLSLYALARAARTRRNRPIVARGVGAGDDHAAPSVRAGRLC